MQPERLVEERRVEGRRVGIAGGPVGGVDLQSPGQVGGAAEELLVEPVAPPTDGLRQRQPRGERVTEGRKRDPPPPAGDPRAESAEEDGPPDAEAAVPDPQRVEGIAARAEVRLRAGHDVVDPATDDAERHGPDGDVSDRPGRTSSSLPATVGDPDRQEDAEDDAEGVGPQRERPQVPDALIGAGDGPHPRADVLGQCHVSRRLRR